MSETYSFSTAAPAKRQGRQGAGRRPEDNPFEDAVKSIVGTPNAVNAAFELDLERGETVKQRKDRIRRFLTRAGKDLAPEGAEAYSIGLNISRTGENSYVANFWDRNAVRAANAGQDDTSEQSE